MRLWSCLCTNGTNSTDDLHRFKQIKRLPFGPNSVINRFHYEPPLPPPPHDFYPKQPKYWQLRGTPAHTRKNYLAAVFFVYCFSGMCIGLYFVEGIGNRWYRRITGREAPTADELYARRNIQSNRNQYHGRLAADPENPLSHSSKDLKKMWRFAGARSDYNREQRGNPGDPAFDDL